jgi:hypothetical protein
MHLCWRKPRHHRRQRPALLTVMHQRQTKRRLLTRYGTTQFKLLTASLIYHHERIMSMPVPEPMTAFTASDDPATGQSNVLEPVCALRHLTCLRGLSSCLAQNVEAAGEGALVVFDLNSDPHQENTATLSAAATPADTPLDLLYRPQNYREDLEQLVFAHSDLALDLTSSNGDDPLLGHWGGYYSDSTPASNNTLEEGLASLRITSHDVLGGSFEGSGTDVDGVFSLSGRIDSDKSIFFVAEWLHHPDLKWAHYGRFDGEELVLQGVWGSPKAEEDASASDTVSSDASTGNDIPDQERELAGPNQGSPGNSAILDQPVSPITSDARNLQVTNGTFLFKRRPLFYFLFRPTEDAFLASRPRALWHWARDSVLAHVRTAPKGLSWKLLRERRDLRRKYIALYNMRMTQWRGMTPTQHKEYADLTYKLPPDDLCLWRALALFVRRRMIVHM